MCLKREEPIWDSRERFRFFEVFFCGNWHHFGGKVRIWFVGSAVLELDFDLPVSVVYCILVYFLD